MVMHDDFRSLAKFITLFSVSSLALALAVSCFARPAATVDSHGHTVPRSGQWVTFRDGESFTHLCCDCGLAHRMRVRIHLDAVQISWERDEAKTRQWRRKNLLIRPDFGQELLQRPPDGYLPVEK